MTLAIEHLKLRLRPINRALRTAVEQQARSAARLRRPDVVSLCITDDQVNVLLDDCDSLIAGGREAIADMEITDDERSRQEELRRMSYEAGKVLPLDRLAQTHSLSDFEQEAVLLCIAPELDRSYERIFGYVLDDLNRRFPCRELISNLSAGTLDERVRRRGDLSRFGRLLRTGLITTHGEAPTDGRQELRAAPGLFEYLTGLTGDLSGLFFDPAEITLPHVCDLPPKVDLEMVERLGAAFRDGHLEVLGVWGSRNSHQAEIAFATATATGRKLRRWIPNATSGDVPSGANLKSAIEMAAALDTLLWIETDVLDNRENSELSHAAADLLASSGLAVILTGTHPWRPTTLLERRAYAEIELDDPSFDTRRTMWERALPEVSEAELGDVAARFRVGGPQVRAAAKVARTQALIQTNGHVVTVGEQLDAACAAVTRQHTNRYGVIVKPKRRPADLILPPKLHEQVLEVAHFFRSLPRVSEDWGFARMMTGGGGIKALFTGDSGVGKTLAAEVIAGELAMPLLKIDLASVVSKWVGETEQNLEAAFQEAEDNHAVLFFDEAEALFGKRGEVNHGTDRYANLEVSFLLQRLEDYAGVCLCSSNLKESIDKAFTRRFQVVLHFPRPGFDERRRIWEIAFPPDSPRDPSIDFDVLASLDMTGAAIVAAATTSAFLAADKGSSTIDLVHVVAGIARQYRSDARLLTPTELGPYATFLNEAR
jgi:hypothetical protein